MEKKKKTRFFIIFAFIFAILIVGIILTGNLLPEAPHEEISVAMKDAVLHETFKINLFGLQVNPAVISAFVVSGILIIAAIVIRIFVIPKFTIIPGKFQMLLEQGVELFSNMAKENSPHCHSFIGGYIFVAGAYICIGTLFELLGLQASTTVGTSIALPAPLADINGAITMGCLTFLVIMGGGIARNGLKGLGKALKEFSLPISMSFRLFGALLSGALVTDLVYHYTLTSYVIPVFVGVIFTLLHALIQAYVLTTLASTYFGEVTEFSEKKVKVPKEKKKKIKAERA
ncbi:MAG: F0F1 ATP synthase subunit A [Lachnospiraceae bacterium]|nr:F0F1 ATP synthase subunit A [Lachnospiraceae bacterium]